MLNGKKVFISGASRGIGFEIARKAVASGAKVAISGRNPDTIREAAEKLGSSAFPLVWDVNDIDRAAEIIADADKLMGGLDIVVCSSGVSDAKTFGEITPADYDKIMNTNLRGMFFLYQAAVKRLRANPGPVRGHILSIASEHGFRSIPTAYALSKHGVVALTEGLGLTLAREGIVVNGVAPGGTATIMIGWKPGDTLDRPYHPNGRLATADEIADLAIFLMDSTGNNIIGRCVLSDGGCSLN